MTKVAVGEIVEIKGGGTPSKANPAYYSGDIPWVTPKDMKVWDITTSIDKISAEAIAGSATTLVPTGSVLVVNRSGILKHTLPVGITRRPVAINQDMKALICGPRVDADYLAHVLKAAEPVVLGWVRATTADNFPIQNLKEFEVPLPHLEEQKRIAAILDQADALRRLRARALDRLNSLGQAIFHEMFESREPERKLPLSELVDILVGHPFKSNHYTEGADTVRLCRGANVLPNSIDWSQEARYPIALLADLREFKLLASDIVIAMDRPWISSGFKAAEISHADLPAYLVQRVARLRAKDPVDQPFVFYTVRSDAFQKHCKATETTVPHISPTDIRSFTVALPSAGERLRFHDRMKASVPLMENAVSAKHATDALFASLQLRAFRGEL